MNTEEATVSRWKQISKGSTNRKIFSAAIMVGTLTFAVKLVAMFKEMIVAAWFGTADSMDAFLIAFLLPSYVINVVAGSFNAALIPIQIETREKQGEAAAQRLFSSTAAFSGVVLLVAVVAMALLGPVVLPHLCSGFDPGKQALTERLFYLLLPSILIAGLATNWEALLNAGERFGLAACAPAAVSVGTLAGIAWLGKSFGIYALAAGTVAGMLLQLALLGGALKRRGFRILPFWHGLDANVRRVIGQYIPMIAGSVLFCSSVLVDQAMAGMLESGSVAKLNYGNKLVALAVGIGTTALGTAVLPHFSKMVALADWSGVAHTLKVYTRLILIVTIPVTLAAMLLSGPIVTLLFQRGNFTSADALAVSRVQQMFLLQLPFYSLSILFVRMISALKGNQILMWGTVVGFSSNVGLNFLLMPLMGVAGIALSTSTVYGIMCAFMAVMLGRRLKASKASRETQTACEEESRAAEKGGLACE